jgi:hypothetical protein
MASDNTDTPDAAAITADGNREFDRIRTDPASVKPGRWTNQGKVDPTHRGPSAHRSRRRKG